ncbi:HupE/UreJ family protein [Krasilnikoviella flava]|uniref:HupE / UreJ protein n=1 Tax=Krasilnikoviella flava TaxID=526729 RepID=A0A1T5LPL0_9MICO|nr:HupE/UreJ family protein [Krasilnikoviella flava]SKC77937.1 HupE / UreJ protein [Krasilnikoviella flava]
MTFPTPARAASRRGAVLAALAVAGAATVLPAGPAVAHDATTDAYAQVAAAVGADVHVELDLEYDLLMKSAWLTAEAYDAQGQAAQEAQLAAHAEEVATYVTERFQVAAGEDLCDPALAADPTVGDRGGKAYATVVLDYSCPTGEETHTLFSALFPDTESFVHSTETMVAYELDDEEGSAVLTPSEPTVTTGEHRTLHRLGAFFVLGAEHLLLGPDHLLFLLALIVGSRRLRDVVLVATAFTVAHSVTFLLAATGAVNAPGAVVEPVIAISIAAVAAWHLWAVRPGAPPRLLTGLDGGPGGTVEPRRRRDLARADVIRLAVVFAFGLVHGLGFAGALGLDEPWSWGLLGSLLVFNVGIEAVQLCIVAIVFPLLVLLRRRSPRVARWVTAVVAAGVALVGVFWFVQRVLGLG